MDDIATGAEDTGLSDVADTSTTADEVSLDDIEVNLDELDDDDSEAESTDEAATESEDEVEEEAVEEVVKDEEPERQRQNRENAKRRIEERERREAEKKSQQSDYLNDAEDDRDLALRQLQVDAYNNRVSLNSDRLQNSLEKAVANIDLFTKGSPEAREELISAVDTFEKMYVAKDKNGDPIEVRGDLYQYLQERAESIRRLVGSGARQEAKAKNATKARVDTVPTRPPKTQKKDPWTEAFEEALKD